MAESMQGLHRSHRCTEVNNTMIGNTVTVMGWVQKSRNKGGIIFVDLRDRSGILQVIFEEANCGAESFAKAEKLRSEFVVAITGEVAKRGGAVNENLATGDIEVIAKDIRILAEADTPPFPIEENSKTKEDLRLKYRYLDLRRPDLQKNIMMRSKVTTLVRSFMAEEGFIEIETPTLCKSTPEGARDYLVPSRIHPGEFYALPQSPQIYKQLLMCSGYDRYFQIARCYRDEDLRADRQPEFTQIDMELSFVDVDDVIDVNERLLAKLFKEVIGVDVQLPIQRMTYKEAMERFGSDKPDLRFGMELCDVTDVVKDCEFVVFKNAIEAGGSVRGINAEGQGAMPRKKIDALVDFAKGYGAKGLAYIAIHEDGTMKLNPGDDTSAKHPLIDSYYTDKRNVINNLNANIYAKVSLPFNISYQMNFSPRYEWATDYVHKSSEHPSWKDFGGSASRTFRNDFLWQLDNIVKWKQTFAKVHDVDFTFLFNAEKFQRWSDEMNNEGFDPNDDLGYHYMKGGILPTISSNDEY